MSMTATDEVLQHEAQLALAKQTLDLEAIDRLYADDLLMTGVLGDPTCSKTAVIDEINRGRADRETLGPASGQFQRSVTNEDIKVTGHGDCVVASYRFVVRVSGPNVNVHRRFRTTNVWLRRNAQWQIVAAHTAYVIDPGQAAILSEEAGSLG